VARGTAVYMKAAEKLWSAGYSSGVVRSGMGNTISRRNSSTSAAEGSLSSVISLHCFVFGFVIPLLRQSAAISFRNLCAFPHSWRRRSPPNLGH
jgi:hypothetical protein